VCNWRNILRAARNIAAAIERADKLARSADIPFMTNGLIPSDQAFFLPTGFNANESQ